MPDDATSHLPEMVVEPHHTKKQSATDSQAQLHATMEQPANVPTELSSAIVQEKGVLEMLRNLHVEELPSYYIKPESMRQQSKQIIKSDSPLNQIPVVDLDSPHEDLVTAIGKACEFGFFQLVNHGISSDLLRRIQAESNKFFSLPAEEKIRCSAPAKVAGPINSFAKPIHFGAGSGGDWREVLKVKFSPESEVAMDYWPVQPEGFRETMVQYVAEQQKLVRRLLEIISEFLGLEPEYILRECGEDESRVLMAINHYPLCPDPSLTMGFREHSDNDTISILLQDHVGGLQVYKEGFWIDVKPMENALVVNVGDHLQILSNGRYPSVLHRAVNNKWKARNSVAIFFAPALSARIQPAPALVDEEHPAQFREFVFGEFLKITYSTGDPNKAWMRSVRLNSANLCLECVEFLKDSAIKGGLPK